MSESPFLFNRPLPFCPGCSHHLVVQNTARALMRLGLKPLDVVLVTDIGCHGIIDPVFRTHTVHGLHGRAPALGAGIAAGLKNGKVIVYMGDGGASIGLQHLVECSRLNFPLTVIVFNNMLYGMTGGQPSSLTPCGFRTPIQPNGKPEPHYDLCRIIHSAGATYVSRIKGVGDFSEALFDALAVNGFSLVEVAEICTSYGLKYNPGRKAEEVARTAGLEFGVWRNENRPVFRLALNYNRDSLLKEKPIAHQFTAPVQDRINILLAGSAGGGIQQAAELLARSAIAAGLHTTKKGTYPVTVGTGYSVAEVIIARKPVLYTGIQKPDVAIVLTAEGLAYVQNSLTQMRDGLLIIDRKLTPPPTGAKTVSQPFVEKAGKRNAANLALLFWLKTTGTLPVAALLEEIKASRGGREDKTPDLLEHLEQLTGNQNQET